MGFAVSPSFCGWILCCELQSSFPQLLCWFQQTSRNGCPSISFHWPSFPCLCKSSPHGRCPGHLSWSVLWAPPFLCHLFGPLERVLCILYMCQVLATLDPSCGLHLSPYPESFTGMSISKVWHASVTPCTINVSVHIPVFKRSIQQLGIMGRTFVGTDLGTEVKLKNINSAKET